MQKIKNVVAKLLFNDLKNWDSYRWSCHSWLRYKICNWQQCVKKKTCDHYLTVTKRVY